MSFNFAANLVGQDDDTTGHLQKILAQIGSFCLVVIGIFGLAEILASGTATAIVWYGYDPPGHHPYLRPLLHRGRGPHCHICVAYREPGRDRYFRHRRYWRPRSRADIKLLDFKPLNLVDKRTEI